MCVCVYVRVLTCVYMCTAIPHAEREETKNIALAEHILSPSWK